MAVTKKLLPEDYTFTFDKVEVAITVNLVKFQKGLIWKQQRKLGPKKSKWIIPSPEIAKRWHGFAPTVSARLQASMGL